MDDVTDTNETHEIPRVQDPAGSSAPDAEAEAGAVKAAKAVETAEVEAGEVEAARDGDVESTSAEPQPRRRSDASRSGSHRRKLRPAPRWRRPLLAVLALASVVAGAVNVPQVRTVLRQSFTQLPQTTTALYFTSDPSINGTVLSVPITVDGKNTGLSTYRVKVWTETAAGKVDGSTSAQVPTVKGVTAAVVRLPVATDAAAVWASLDGTGQVIHFKIS